MILDFGFAMYNTLQASLAASQYCLGKIYEDLNAMTTIEWPI